MYNSLTKVVLYLLLYILLSLFPLYSQEKTDSEELYVLEKVTYDVKGQTKPWAVENFYKIKEKTRFHSQKEISEYFAQKEASMQTNKTFLSVKFDYIISQTIYQKSPILKVNLVHLTIKIEDSFTFLIIPPIPKISNDKAPLTTKIYERNLGGSLIDFTASGKLDLDLKPEKRSLLSDHEIAFSFGNILLRNKVWDLNTFYKYQTEVRRDPISDEKTLDYGWYTLHLGIGSFYSLAPYLRYNFTFNSDASFGYNFFIDTKNIKNSILKEKGMLNNSLGYYLGYQHSLNYSKITEKKAFLRDGFAISLSNYLGLNFNILDFKSNLEWNLVFFKTLIDDNLEISTRFLGFWNIRDSGRSVAYMRGVKQHHVFGFLGNYFNNTLVFTFIKDKKLGEAQIGLFLDGGLTKKKSIPLSFESFDIGAGMEGRLQLNILKSFLIYGRVGLDLKRLPQRNNLFKLFGGPYDINIGLSAHY